MIHIRRGLSPVQIKLSYTHITQWDRQVRLLQMVSKTHYLQNPPVPEVRIPL
jgi:hypothetical protein